MGWSSEHRGKGISHRDFFSNLLHRDHTIVECATVRGVFYAAVRDDKGDVSALVALVRWSPKSSFNFSYKTMSESMGPVYYDAPARVLNALTPTDNTYANAWRQECRKMLEARTQIPRVRIGDTIRFDQPVSFTNGARLDTVRLVRRGTFVDPETGGQYRIPGYRNRAFTVVQSAS